MVSLTVEEPKVGPVNATTDSDTGYRTYSWEGRELPSVTTIKSMAGMSYNIHRWALNCVVDRAVDQNDSLNRMLAATDEASRTAAKKWLLAAATEEKDRAADLGTRIHDAAAKNTDLTRVAPDMHAQLRQYHAWLEQEKPEVLYTEQQVFNLTLGYAGTFDMMCRMPDGETYIVDIKTGKSTFPEHALQLCAYSLAEWVGENDVIDWDATNELHGVSGVAILHLQKTQWKWQEVQITPRMFRAWRGLVEFATWSGEHRAMKTVLSGERKGKAI